jgi:hypothetical protein
MRLVDDLREDPTEDKPRTVLEHAFDVLSQPREVASGGG